MREPLNSAVLAICALLVVTGLGSIWILRDNPTTHNVTDRDRVDVVERKPAFRFYKHPRMVITWDEIDFSEWLDIDILFEGGTYVIKINGKYIQLEPLPLWEPFDISDYYVTEFQFNTSQGGCGTDYMNEDDKYCLGNGGTGIDWRCWILDTTTSPHGSTGWKEPIPPPKGTGWENSRPNSQWGN